MSGAGDRLAQPALGPLVDELVRRYERGDRPVRVTLPTALGHEGLAAIADLLGLDRYPDPGWPLPVDRLAAAIGTDAAGLRRTVEELRGPIVDRSARRRDAHAARTRLWDHLTTTARELSLFADTKAADRWVERVRSAGIPGGDVDAHHDRLDRATAVLARLPAGGVTLAGLAADVLGDAHGLDANRRVGRLVVDAVAIALDVDTAADARGIRGLWERVGVVTDPLSSTVLALGLPATGTDPLSHFLSAATDASEPIVVTYAQLRRWPVTLPAGVGDVYVVENPSLLTEAAGSGWQGPPLVCSSGRPTVAVVTLLGQIRTSDVAVHHHADFDPSGLDIVRWLAERAGSVPWRMSAADYRNAVAATGSTLPITATVPDTPWDPALAVAMRATGVAVHEEAIRHTLLTEIARPSS